MVNTIPVRIQSLNCDSNLFEAVIALHRAEKKTLGMFPRGAFEDHARRNWILVAVGPNGECMGYLLFRVAKGRAAITHLCVSRTHRGKGVAKALIDELKETTKALSGISLYCRRDYEANVVWPRFGFVVVASKRGRGTDGAELEYWWFNHNHPDLFSYAADNDPKLVVVIDANIFFDLHDRTTAESDDSKALQADWLKDQIELCLTQEIFNEIHRAPSQEQRERSRRNAGYHRLLNTKDEDVQQFLRTLEVHFPEGECLRDGSDARQIAHALAAEIPFFVTRDRKLIEKCESLFETHGLRVLHPTDLINELDSLRREAEYRPVRLEGSQFRTTLLRADQIERVVATFKYGSERPADLERGLRHFLAKPNDYECKLVSGNDNIPVLISVTTKKEGTFKDVVLLRVGDHPLAPTIARHIIREMIEKAAKTSTMLRLEASKVSAELTPAFQDLGFINSSGSWLKVPLAVTTPARMLIEEISRFSLLSETSTELTQVIECYAKNPSVEGAAAIEKALWPAKIADETLPTFLVPIQARWAQHFFDSDAASGMLFGLNESLHLGIEGAYFCSGRHKMLKAPGRVLWYVSRGNGATGSKCIKACSRIEEVMLGTAKEVFKAYKRLGVYEWRNVFEAAKKDHQRKLIAFRFSLTERFSHPVTLQELKKLGLKAPFMSPRKIGVDQFVGIYRLGRNMT